MGVTEDAVTTKVIFKKNQKFNFCLGKYKISSYFDSINVCFTVVIYKPLLFHCCCQTHVTT